MNIAKPTYLPPTTKQKYERKENLCVTLRQRTREINISKQTVYCLTVNSVCGTYDIRLYVRDFRKLITDLILDSSMTALDPCLGQLIPAVEALTHGKENEFIAPVSENFKMKPPVYYHYFIVNNFFYLGFLK